MTEPRRSQRNPARRHAAALASRLLPLVVLAVGASWILSSTQVAMGQFTVPQNMVPQNTSPQNNSPPSNAFRNGVPQNTAPTQAATYPEAYIATAPPAIPSAAVPNQSPPNGLGTPADGTGPNAEAAESAPWEIPEFVQKIAQGGWLMVPLGICSLIVITLSLERLVALRRARVIPRPFVRRFTECVEDGQLSYEEATELCEEFDCPVAEVFRAAVRRWGRPMFEIEQAVMDAGDRVADGLKRFLRVFHAVSNVAPLLGLLGTVLGMIEAFEIISTQESLGRPESLASGISTALMTTAGGLSVAIPAYLAYMYFGSKSDSYLGEIDRLCQRVVDCISAESLEETTRTSRKRKAA